MSSALQTYRASLKRQLYPSGSARQRLLAQFDQMSALFLEEVSTPSPEQLAEAFGTPKALARTLMKDMTRAERQRQERRRWLLRIAAAALVVFLACTCIWYVFESSHPVEIVETTVIHDGGY